MNIKTEKVLGFLLISIFLLTLTAPTVHAYVYPPKPLLKVILDRDEPAGTFVANVWLMGEGGVNLDPFWDVAGFDITMNFPGLEALSVTIDPNNWFKSFWPFGLQKKYTINNDEGTLNVLIAGMPLPGGSHTPPNGKGRLFSVKFATPSPPIPVEISLMNPRTYVHRTTLDSDAGPVDLSNPVGTQWHAITPDDHGTPFSLDAWEDIYPDGILGPSDDLILMDTDTGLWHCYEMHDILGTLTLAQQQFSDVDLIWMADFPNSGLSNNGLPGVTATGGTAAVFNGFGLPYWTGNFTTEYPIDFLNTPIVATFLPFTGDEYTQVLVEGVDYKVYADEELIELLVPLDVPIINEHWVDGVNNTLNGWPFINYVASGIESVYRKFPAPNEYYGETEGFATNNGYAKGPPSEWWYDPEWPWELEGWWALGYGGLAGPWTWPDGTEWLINYTAASYVTVDYAADFDPRPYSVEYDGTYEEFLALGDPIGTTWSEVYPNSLGVHTVIDWTDSDLSGDITVGDYLSLEGAVGIRTYLVENKATDLIVDQVGAIDDVDLTSPFYGMEPIVRVAGFPHPEREMSPWHNSQGSKPIPHIVENAMWPFGPLDPVNPPYYPVADFTATPRVPEIIEEMVVFDASGSYDTDGTIVSYEWDFGDGTTATGSIVSHAYEQRGFYLVSLTVADNDGLKGYSFKTMAIRPVMWAKAEHSVYDVSKDEDAFNDLAVLVRNYGTASVEVTARFATYDRRTGILIGPTLGITDLATAGTQFELMRGWDPTKYEWAGTKTQYTVSVTITYKDFDGTILAGKSKINFAVAP